MRSLGTLTIGAGLALLTQITSPSPASAQQVTVDAEVLEELQAVIRRQQRQIEDQSRVLQSVQRQLNDIRTDTAEAKTEAKKATAAVTQQPAGDYGVALAPTEEGKERIKVSLSGMLNRAANTIYDGKDTQLYNVDSDADPSKFRFDASAQITEDLSLAGRLEYSISQNNSGDVSQDNENAGTFTDARWVDASFSSKQYGTVRIGQGSTAADDSSGQDLSRTQAVQNASIADIMAGMQFRDTNLDLTGITTRDAFTDFDGLSRVNRVRYDSPNLAGFQLRAAAVSDQRWDASVFWGGQTDNFKMLAAGGITEPNEDGIDLQYNGSFSMLHEPTGLNLTLMAGMKDVDGGGPQSNLWSKFGYLADIFGIGKTAFAVDYRTTKNLPDAAFEGYSVGGAIVQHLEKYGAQVYAQFRRFKLDENNAPNLKAINGGTIGTVITF